MNFCVLFIVKKKPKTTKNVKMIKCWVCLSGCGFYADLVMLFMLSLVPYRGRSLAGGGALGPGTDGFLLCALGYENCSYFSFGVFWIFFFSPAVHCSVNVKDYGGGVTGVTYFLQSSFRVCLCFVPICNMPIVTRSVCLQSQPELQPHVALWEM